MLEEECNLNEQEDVDLTACGYFCKCCDRYIDNLEFRYSNEDTVDYCEDCYKKEGNDMILEKHLINLDCLWACDMCNNEIDEYSYRWTYPYHNYDLCLKCYNKDDENMKDFRLATTNSSYSRLFGGVSPMNLESESEYDESDEDPFMMRAINQEVKENVENDNENENEKQKNDTNNKIRKMSVEDLLNISDEEINEKDIDPTVFYKVCYDKRLIFRMIDFYYKFKERIDINCIYYNTSSLICHSDIGITRWLIEVIENMENFKKGIQYQNFYYNLIRYSINSETLLQFRWLIKNHNDKFKNLNVSDIKECILGSIYTEDSEFFLYFESQYPEIIKTFESNKLMTYSFYGNNVKLVDYIYNKYKDIDLNKIWKTCLLNNNDVEGVNNLKWLLEHCNVIDLTYNDHQIFYMACKINSKEKVDWLSKKIPNIYYYDIDEDTGDFYNYGILRKLEIYDSILLEEKEIKICSICYENKSNVISDCDHQFCKTCISKWYRTRTDCPYCRNEIDDFKQIGKV